MAFRVTKAVLCVPAQALNLPEPQLLICDMWPSIPPGVYASKYQV